MPSPLSQGCIVWVTIPNPRGGKAKARPAVVITATVDITATGDVQVAAITTLVGEASFTETVELPYASAGHPLTKLKKPCEVVCSWIASVPISDVRNSGGVVPSDVLVEILAKVQRLA